MNRPLDVFWTSRQQDKLIAPCKQCKLWHLVEPQITIRCREALGWNQTGVAARARLSLTTVRNVERGREVRRTTINMYCFAILDEAKRVLEAAEKLERLVGERNG